jgi:hypothetical protein
MQPAKDRFIELIREGLNIEPALEKVGRSRKTYEDWRRNDPAFKAKVDQARQLRGKRDDVVRGERLGFAEWRKKYLHQDTFWHQHQWIDVLEGREPRDLHPAQTYEPANRNRLLVNVPPEHAKTVTISTEYVVYRLCMDPSFRVLIISAGQGLANSIVYDIQQIMTSPDYVELQKAYAPDGGWEAGSESWRESQIIFGAATRAEGNQDTHQKDPNVLALGMRSKIYGRRADLVIVDDAVDTTNVSEYAKQMTWLRKMVESRIVAKGRMIVVGTRIASVDLYSELRKVENYANGKSPWSYFASPAILEEGKTPAEHVTLWPRSSHPLIKPDEIEAGDVCICGREECAIADSDGLFSKWDGVHLEAGPRSSNNNSDWALVYQQKSVPDDATFPEHAVTRSINGLRLCGRLEADRAGHPYSGMHGKYVIASLDPSIKGFAGMIVGAVDRETQKRFLMNAFNMKAPTKDQLIDKMKQVTEHYGVHEWRVEKTGMLQFFTQDAELRRWMQNRGVKFTEHMTGSNKWDAGFGVSSLASLFGEYDKAWNDQQGEWREITAPLIELPRPNQDGIKTLIHQLITWTPDLDPSKVPCDLVMALWFLEIGAREHLGYGKSGSVTVLRRSSKFVSPRRTQQGTTVRLADYHGQR